MNSENARPAPDKALTDMADYVNDFEITSAEAFRMARFCLMDALGCAFDALSYPDCTKLLGPILPGTVYPNGSRVPATQLELDPVTAAFDTSVMIRWLDFNDGFTAAQGGHPSDNIGGILAAADYVSRQRIAERKSSPPMRDVLVAMIKAYEIQGMISLGNDLAGIGFDTCTGVRIASTAVVAKLLGGTREEIVNAISNAWVDGGQLTIFRQGNNTGWRKSWAGGDMTSRAVWLALMALKGEMGYPSALTMKRYGFQDAVFKGQPIVFKRPYGSYVIENVKFKFVAAGMHSQSAAECAFRLHPLVKDRIDEIDAITITTQKEMKRVMDKTGPLSNPADRDHCAQYIVAVGMLHGDIQASDYEDDFAADPRIDRLREKMTVVEEPRYSRDFADPDKLSSANAIEVRFRDGTSTPKIEVEYPLGHARRRAEFLPALEAKFRKHLAHRYPPERQASILELFADQERLEKTSVDEFMTRLML